MNLLQRIEKLESARGIGIDAAARIMAEEMRRYLATLTDEELNAVIAKGEKEPCDPEQAKRLQRMTDEELCRLIIEGDHA